MDEEGLTRQVQIPAELFELANKNFKKNWQDDKVVIKLLEYGDNLKIKRASIKIRGIPGNRNLTADMSAADWESLTILYGVVSAPWGANSMEAIEHLPTPIGDWIRSEVEKFNTLEVKKKLDSTESSTE